MESPNVPVSDLAKGNVCNSRVLVKGLLRASLGRKQQAGKKDYKPEASAPLEVKTSLKSMCILRTYTRDRKHSHLLRIALVRE